ncbi:MAG: methyl-accepting chemotaxis protein [Treponema sp.]|jgi:methyl-accepting chemotaxis protein|nr:methyl-accepting chemotaxis protein [Treponema sp.]
MRLEDNEGKGFRVSIRVKISAVAAFFVLLVTVVMGVSNIQTMEDMGRRTAVIMGEEKLKGDIVSFETSLKAEYGSLSLQDGDIVDQWGNSLEHQYDVVDRLSSSLNIVATVFVKEQNDYRRLTTSIRDSSGKRAVDTLLGTKSAAYAPIQSGKEYVGNAVILGKAYLTAYYPLFQPNTREVIGILFIGIETSSIDKIISDSSKAEIRKIVIIAVVVLLVSILLNSLSSNFIIVKPILSAVAMLKEISQGEGDLTKHLKAGSKDEIGDMAHYFNLTLEKIKKLVIVIKQQAAMLSGIGSDLASNMTETATAVNEITANIQSIKGRVVNQSAGVTETSASMRQALANIEKLDSNIAKQSGNISQVSSAIEEMVSNIHSVTETLVKNTDNVQILREASEVGRSGLQEVATDIQEIARESEGLLEINAVMENIASQTNLLSMNAAIEAAHAGEAGKGFAVVADEIRKLAESSGTQSKTIGNVLKKIKESIDKITKSTENVLNRFEAIETGVKTVSQQEENIRNAMEGQGEGSKQILQNASDLSEISRLVHNGSDEIEDGVNGVIRESSNLEKLTQEITGGMNEMASGADQVNTAVNHVNEISVKNREGIDALIREVSRFKVD